MVRESTPPITALRALWDLDFEIPQVFRVEGLEILIIIDTNCEEVQDSNSEA